MKFIPLHTKNTAIVYKNALCSSATLVVLVFVVLSVMIPVLLVSLLSPYSGIAESRILYEQPRLHYKFESIFFGETQEGQGTAKGLVVCSTFGQLNEPLKDYTPHCEGVKYWSEDLDHDGHIDRAHFELQLEELPHRLKSFELVLFFAAELQHKCHLTPPAVLTQQLSIPTHAQMTSGSIVLKGELQLKQSIEFTCPFPGRTSKTHFRPVQLPSNATVDVEAFQLAALLAQLKANPAYFQLAVQETYYRRGKPPGLRLQVEVDVLQVPARYHLSVWERLGQFWLYFASFFGISFYIMNKLKDFLFGRHIIRAWEIIPWKKLY